MRNYLRQNEALTIISIEVVLMMMGIGLIGPILPQYARNFGISITMVGLLITAFGAARLVFDIPAGRLAERLGCRPVLVAGPAVLAIGSAASGLASSYWQLLAFQVVEGIGSAMYTTAAMIYLANISVPANRGRMMSLYQGSVLLGAGIGPTVGGFVAQFFGLRAPFFVLSGFSILAAFWAYLRLPETQPKSLRHRVLKTGENSNQTQPRSSTGLKPLLGNFTFILISLVTFGVFFTRNAAQNQVLPLLGNERMGLSTGQIGIALTLVAVIQFTAIFIGGRLSDRFGRKAVITPGCFLVAIGLAMLSQSNSYWFLLLSCFFMGAGMGISGPTPAAYVADIIPKENYSNSMGLYRSIGDLGFVIGPVLLGYLADIRGFSFSLMFNCGFILLTTLLFQVMAKETRGSRR